MSSVSYSISVPPGKTPILSFDYQFTLRKQSYLFPLTGTILQVFYEPPGLPEIEVASIDATELAPMNFQSPPLQTPPGNNWILQYYYRLRRALQPIDKSKQGLNVVRVVGKWYQSSERHLFQGRPDFWENAFDTAANFQWSTLEDPVIFWPPLPEGVPVLNRFDTDIQAPGASVFPLPTPDSASDFEFVFEMLVS